MDDKIRDLERRIVELEKVRAVDHVLRDSIEKRLASIENTLTWLVRLVVSGFVTGAIAVYLTGGMF